jgi:hypothetical protein
VTGPEEETAPARPVLRIVRGDPSPEEVAALTAVLAAASGGGAPEPDPGPASAWVEREALVRRPLTPGPNAWRMSNWR